MAESTGSSWADVLLSGINAYNDSQASKAYTDQVQAYNTQAGTAGQSQAYASISASPVLLIGGVLVLGLVLFLALRR